MNILFITRASLYTNKGGDTVQVMNTARYLQMLGVKVDIRLANEKLNYEGYDILHFFNIIRPADILYHIRRSGKPFVVSTIYVDYSEFDKLHRKGLSGLAFRMLPAHAIEYLKVIARMIFNKEMIVSPEYLWKGHKRSVELIIRKASLLLPNSENEYKRLQQSFGTHQKYKVIPNAVDSTIFNNDIAGIKDERMVLCVGRIEGLKNQLNLIRALNGTGFRLFIIGNPSLNQLKYYDQCIEEAGSNVFFIKGISQLELAEYYRKAKVHILPSWFETTGLSSLEAGAMGCNIVITDRGDAKEYFGNMAFYCEPGSIESIKEAVEQAATGQQNIGLPSHIQENFNWEIAARKTFEAYQMIIT